MSDLWTDIRLECKEKTTKEPSNQQNPPPLPQKSLPNAEIPSEKQLVWFFSQKGLSVTTDKCNLGLVA